VEGALGVCCSLISFDNGNTYVTIIRKLLFGVSLLPVANQYEDANGRSPFEEWFIDLHPPAAAKVTGAIIRMEQGNFSNAKGVGAGVFEYKIDFGPGYRIYFGKDGDQLIILLGGGTKKKQQRDIDLAAERWHDYKRRKKLGAI
jgi:putative addiction module killer protein